METTPDELWSPDAVDPYQLAIDLAAMQQAVQDAISALRSEASQQRGVSVRTSIAQATHASAYTAQAIVWNVEDYDTDNFHDVLTNNSRLTAPSTGLYRVTAKVRTASTIYNGGVQLGINGSIDIASRVVSTVSASAGSFAIVTRTYSLAAGNYVEAFSLGQAAALDLSTPECYFEMVRV